MEANEEVLVVIQAESGEEIALPLAALGEQHQEVVVDSDGITTIIGSQKENEGHATTYTATNGFEMDGETSSGEDSKQMIMDSPHTKPATIIKEPRVKQKRKEKLVLLPLFEDDIKLEFQTFEHSTTPIVEEPKKKPRKEYRTKKRLAALEPQEGRDTSPASSSTPTSTPAPASTNTPTETLAPSQQKTSSPTPPPTPVQPTSERRTRLSNAYRVATGKMYKCNDCDFSTERINNIISHMKETCPKIKKERL